MPDTQEQAIPVDASADEPQELALDEFCMRKSASDKRVELIAGFHFLEKRSGQHKDTEEAYEARFQQFINKPV